MDEIMRLVRPAIRELRPYASMRAIVGRVSASQGMAAHGGSPRGFDHEPWFELDDFADFYGVPGEYLLFTRDVDEAVDLLVRGFCVEGSDAVLQTRPTFATYQHAARVQGADVVEVPLRPNSFQLDPARVLAAYEADPRTKLMFFCSPNDPTANLLDRSDILRIASALFGRVIVVVDQVYLDYSGAESLATAVSTHPNIVVLRSLPAEYTLAGHLGVTIAHPEIVAVLSRILPSCSMPGQRRHAAARGITLLDVLRSAVEIGKVLAERARVTQGLEASPAVVRVFPSDAPFLLVRVDDARELAWTMARSGIAIYDGSALPGAPNSVRISIGTPAENDALLAVLDRYVDERTPPEFHGE
ncbi:aminotransferase class I/II-fold pyridoxal phosphate-dependent enzyme [Nocardia brasiliensis]|uniref:aminotransferase class I/II-fold pyridoxal phosphate-dependent enzyme n=1 Tax=Nocardia brasiliensis TaxID=37326 RepID=UPI003D9476B4